jgi:hypothetical protein
MIRECTTTELVNALEACRAENQRLRKEVEAIGDRAWNHAITRCINELHNMKHEDARRLADRIAALRVPKEKP